MDSGVIFLNLFGVMENKNEHNRNEFNKQGAYDR
jgi:hypothetical protein